MKKNILLGLVSGVCLANLPTQADTITVAWGYDSVPSAPAIVTIYDSANHVVESFQSFCLENSEYFEQGYHYDYTTDSTVVYGEHPTGTPPSSPLTVGAVDLYQAYESGVLTDAGLVQQAIWYDQGYSAFGTPAVLALGGSYLDMSAYSGPQNVLNLYTPNNGDGLDDYNGNGVYTQRQSFLGHVPDGGTTVMLLGIGLAGLALISRRFAVAR